MTIRELSAQQKLSQAEFARRIGVSQVTVSMIESGDVFRFGTDVLRLI